MFAVYENVQYQFQEFRTTTTLQVCAWNRFNGVSDTKFSLLLLPGGGPALGLVKLYSYSFLARVALNTVLRECC